MRFGLVGLLDYGLFPHVSEVPKPALSLKYWTSPVFGSPLDICLMFTDLGKLGPDSNQKTFTGNFTAIVSLGKGHSFRVYEGLWD